MTFKCSVKTYLPLLLIVLMTSYVWGGPLEEIAVRQSPEMGVYIITHDEIIGSGARHLADVLKRVPANHWGRHS